MQNPGLEGTLDLFQLFQSQLAVLGFDIDHHITYLFIGLQVLGGDIDIVVGKRLVDLRQYARLVFMDMQQAAGAGMLRQGDFREINRGQG